MLRFSNKILKRPQTTVNCGGSIRSLAAAAKEKTITIPESADVVVIGGGSAGCNAFYHLAKRGVKAVLLERSKLTSGTTWHTAGLVWRLRPNDTEVQLLASTRKLLGELEEETGVDPGWISNGALFIARTPIRLDEYKRVSSLGRILGVEHYILSPKETEKIFPHLNPEVFIGSLYSPGDGVVDPAMLCTALTRSATKNGGQLIENCPVTKVITGENTFGEKFVKGVITPHGIIKTNIILNATGVWGRDLAQDHGIHLPLVPMRHSYIISEPIDGIRGMPNVRDHDASIYFRIQGSSISMGGYESNPYLLDRVPTDFHFGLYDLNWSTFDGHVEGATELCPAFGTAGVKSTISGPESFTPDHKPLMGPDPRLDGLFHSCGYNSAGMMLGGGCGEQIASWIINGKPDLYMFSYDIRRFTPKQTENKQWALEKSHEAYLKNYAKVFPNDQSLAGRSFNIKDPLYEEMIKAGAVADEKQGWERSAFFTKNEIINIPPYDWYGSYGNKLNTDRKYEEKILGDCKYEFSDHHSLIGKEAIACRNNVAIFNISYFCKLFITGAQAKEAADWIFTADTNRDVNKTIYTCALNKKGGVEGDVTVSVVEPGTGELHDPIFKGRGYYVVAGGASANYTKSHIKNCIKEKNLKADVFDVTEKLGIISIQGPKSRELLQKITEYDLSDNSMPAYTTSLFSVKSGNEQCRVRAVRVSFVGELGYELHVPNHNCVMVYKAVMDAGKSLGVVNGGFRSLYSLSVEKGYHLWGHDLRTDDTPIEANLGFTCRKNGEYKGKSIVEEQRKNGIKKRLVFITVSDQIPIWGLEGIYRNGDSVGYLRKADYGHVLEKSIGTGYIKRPDGKAIDAAFINSGKYQIDVMGKLYDVTCSLKSPFDPENKRISGIYN